MAIALVASTSKGSSDSGASVTTDAVDTSGANLIVISATTFGSGAITPTDSKGNTWTALTSHNQGSYFSRFYYCASPTVGTGHTFTLSGVGSYPVLSAMAFSGALGASPADQENGAGTASGTSLATGSITPSEDNCVVVAGISTDPGTGHAMSGYTVAQSDWVNSEHIGGGISYLVQTTAAAANPSWSWTGASAGVASIASFKAAAVASGNPAVGGRGRLRHWGLVP